MLRTLYLSLFVALLSVGCGADKSPASEPEDDAAAPAEEADAEPVDAGEASDAEHQLRDAGGSAADAATTKDAASSSQDAGTPAKDAGAPPSANDAGASKPACPASTQGAAAMGKDTFVPNTGKSAVNAITYTNVGAAGAYAEVIDGWSKATGCMGDPDGTLCKSVYRKEKRVEGALAPFNEEQTVVFAGPTELYQLAVYAPRDGTWQRDAYWDRCRSEGLVFAGNKHWHECAGFVESYVNADGTKESATPVQFAGSIAAGTEVHVMASGLCSGSGASSDCGYSSGLPLHGFRGDAAGSKLFAVKLRMPIGSKTPAYWILPSQVVRSAQYGCNCRGMGSDPVYKGGCGELDVAEILGGVTTSLEATSTLYSFQDITGGGSVTFARPVLEAAVFLVIFDAPSRQIAIRRLPADGFAFGADVSHAQLAQLLADKGTQRALR